MAFFNPPDKDECVRRGQIEKLLQKRLKHLSLRADGLMWEGHSLTCRLYGASDKYLGVAFFPIKKLDADLKGTLGQMIDKTIALFQEMHDVQRIL